MGSSGGEPKTRGRTQREHDEDREDARMRQETQGEKQEKRKGNEVEDEGRPSSLV